MPQVQNEEPRRRGRPTESKHPFPRALQAAGTTVAAWAKANGYTRAAVQSWLSKPPHGRPIPSAAAAAIAAEFPSVPATEKTWKNGIR